MTQGTIVAFGVQILGELGGVRHSRHNVKVYRKLFRKKQWCKKFNNLPIPSQPCMVRFPEVLSKERVMAMLAMIQPGGGATKGDRSKGKP